MATNTLFTNDNLFILHGMNSNLVDLIYLDPPFNSKRMYSAPVGSKAAGSSFKDMWTWQDVDEAYLETLATKYPALTKFIASSGVIHSKAMMAYLSYMTQRIVEMHRILKSTGSLYLHCDPTASHYLKVVLDEVFGKDNFRSIITWKRSSAHSDAKQGRKALGNISDNILYYTKSNDYTFNQLYTPYSEDYIRDFYKYVDEKGRRYRLDNLTGPGGSAKGNPAYEVMGVTRHWRYSKSKMRELIKEGRIVQMKKGNVPAYKRYLDEMPGVPLQNIWDDIGPIASQSKERTGYPTQKPLALLQRIIKTSSNEGDLVLDPFCGCATTCVAAQQLERKWIGIDIEKQAVDILVSRLSDDAGMFKDFINTAAIPQRTDIRKIEPAKSVRERLYKEQSGLCNGCRTAFEIRNLEIDHIVPKSKGGGDYYENYQLLCGSCNRMKGDRPMEYLRMKIKRREEVMGSEIMFGE